MKLKAFALIAVSTASLILGAPASARFLGLSTVTVPNEFGLLTVQVFADFDSPGLDFLSAVYGTDSNPLIIQVVAGTFYQHPLFGDWAPNPAAFQKYPALRYDTFVTLGVESFNPNDPGHPEGRPADHVTFVNFPGFDPAKLVVVDGAWAVVPIHQQGDPFDSVYCFPGDGRVLIGQFSTENGVRFRGNMVLQLWSDGVIEQHVVSFGGGASGGGGGGGGGGDDDGGGSAESVWFVDDDSCPGTGNGSEFDPFCSIQIAIDVAADGNEIFVEPGTYFETIDFLGKQITLRSTGGPEVTIIDGTGLGPVSVVTCNSGEGSGTLLDGFTITGGASARGGGMFNNGSSPTVFDCIFTNNFADDFGGGMYNDNGSNPSVTYCTFSGNHTAHYGGGMASMSSNPTVTNCTFIGNDSVNGGGMANFYNSPTVANCTFTGNTALNGGGMANFHNTAMVVNCTFSRNTATALAGAMYNVNEINSIPTVTNCIFWGDSPDEFGVNNAVVTYSYVQGGWPGTGNIDADPRFVDPDNGDYRLSLGSPCIDAGDSTAVPSSVDVDLDGDPRLVDAVNYLDTGYGSGPMVDMGAYETDELTPPAFFAAEDLLWRHTSGQTYVWLMEGMQLVDFGPPGSAGPTWEIAGAGDFDGDSHADILWRDTSSGLVVIWFMDGTQRVGAGAVGAVPLSWQIVGTGNFDGDPEGRSDILWRNTSTGQVVIWLLDGTQLIGHGAPGSAGPVWEIAGVGDFDGDARADILWRNTSGNGQVVVWFIDGTERIGVDSAGFLPHEWQIVGTGNFDGDMLGRADILWRHNNGQVLIWLMDGAQTIGLGSPGNAGPSWQIVDTGDLDGDGRSDILWRNQAPSGQVFVWLIQGTALAGYGPLRAIPHEWQLVGTGDFNGE